MSTVMNISTNYTVSAEDLKEEAARLQEISNELRRRSIQLRFDNRLLRKAVEASQPLPSPTTYSESVEFA